MPSFVDPSIDHKLASSLWPQFDGCIVPPMLQHGNRILFALLDGSTIATATATPLPLSEAHSPVIFQQPLTLATLLLHLVPLHNVVRSLGNGSELVFFFFVFF
jgi:hypothetical protein